MDMVTALLQLQDHDLALVRLEKELDEMPEKRAILAARAKLAEIEKLKERSQAAMHAIDASSKSLEDRIATISAKMDTEQAKMLSGALTNPKELQAVSHELDALQRRKNQLEIEDLALMERREAAAAQVAKIDAALVEGHRREGQLTDAFKKHGGEVLARTEAEKHARAAIASALDPGLLSRYEASRERHGTAVGVLTAGRCSACRVGLPAVKVNELESGAEDIATCPNCTRLLIVRGA